MTKNFEATLIEINKYINIDKNREKYTFHYNALRNRLFELLQKQDQFKSLFNGHSLQGSYGDNLKVNMPDEFDSVFILKLIEYKRAIIEKDQHNAGNVRINITNILEKIKTEVQNKEIYRLLLKWVDENNYLIVEKIQSWLTGCFHRVLTEMDNKIVVRDTTASIKYRRQGPAHTLFISGPQGFEYSVDFVPGLMFSQDQNVIVKSMEGNWLAIPKPLKPVQTKSTSFRSSFFYQESEIIKNKKNLKNVLRMMKKFRDVHKNLNNLKSYYIKTVFLMKAKDSPKEYWNSPISRIVIDMFHDLEKKLYDRELLFFWDRKCNMFACYSAKQMDEMQKCITSHKATLLSGRSAMDPTLQFKIYKIFLTNVEREKENISNPNVLKTCSQKSKASTVENQKVPANQNTSKIECNIS